MGTPELLVLSLGLSVAVAALAWVGGRLVEAASADPRLRDRTWGGALLLSALPPLAVSLMLLAPAPVREIALTPPPMTSAPLASGYEAPISVAPPLPPLDISLAAMAVLILAGFMSLARLAALASKVRRLQRLLRTAWVAPATTAMVETTATSLSAPVPLVDVSDAAPEPMLVGFTRPRLILPADLVRTSDSKIARAVIAHELAHLKRGDHRALWIEEALLVVLAINPLLPVLRARRAAAREEACDALALAGAPPEARRAYARCLIETLRSRAGPQPLPALTLTGAGRRLIMHRLDAIISPAPAAHRRTRLLATAVGCAVLGAVAMASVAVAGQREPGVKVVDPDPTTESNQSGEAAARHAVMAAQEALTPEQKARFADPTGSEYQDICASTEAGDVGYCAGVMFSQLQHPGVCLPDALDQRVGEADGSALTELVSRGKAEIARAQVRPDDRAVDVARAALAAAYPCGAS